MESAYKVLNFFSGNKEHELLEEKQVIFMKIVKIEFYKTLDF
jgi:hypothetical protein